MQLPDNVRLCLGTLTALRVPAPRRIDAAVARQAMLLAPVVGLLLAVPIALTMRGVRATGAPSLLGAALALALLALLTRGLHLDGLADTADGLGSGRPAAGALEIMHRSDIGPFGVVTLALVVLVQAAAMAGLPAPQVGLAVIAGRALLPLACRRSIPAARQDGLGAGVASVVPVGAAIAVALALAAGAALVLGDWRAAVGVAVAMVGGEALLRHCVRRLGGVTGDVLGALVEIGTTVALVTLALVAPG